MSKLETAIAAAMAVWSVVATIVSTKVAAPTGPKWKVILYTVVVDMPSWYASVGRTGLLGRANVPGLPSLTVAPKAAPAATPPAPPAELPEREADNA
jgi:hypothetical protein